MGARLIEILIKRNDDFVFPSPHVHSYVDGYEDHWFFVTNDMWHLLWKHGKHKRMRKAK